MKYFFGLLILVLIVLFEASVLSFFPIFGIQPNFLLVIILALQFLGLAKESYYGAFFGGLLLDLLTNAIFGLSSLILLVLTGVAGSVRRFVEGSPPILLLVTFVASVVFCAVRSFPTFNPAIFLKEGLVDVGAMLLIYPILRYVLKSLFARREIEVGV